ncbi:MAG: KfrA protein [Oceanospirillaceae bacterium]|nr:KfrA protein [Oceanospirillaceae bacterium]
MDIKPAIRDRIIQAAEHLVSKGIEKPTNDQVRERLGGGSLSHISPVMREWRQARQTTINTALEIPETLQKAIQVSIGQVWESASQLATAKTEEIQTQAQETITEMQAELSEALAEVTRLEKELGSQTELAERQFADISRLSEETRDYRSDIQRLTLNSDAMETRLSDYKDQIEELKAELKESREDNKKLQQSLVEIVRQRDDSVE